MSDVTRAAVVIGWIDRSKISSANEDVSPDVVATYPFRASPFGWNLISNLGCLVHLLTVMGGGMRRPRHDSELSPLDCDYIARWMFWQAANLPPPRRFDDDKNLLAFLDL